jgi:hypothetical protein
MDMVGKLPNFLKLKLMKTPYNLYKIDNEKKVETVIVKFLTNINKTNNRLSS